ncbi:unnamed protein product [Dicrocoelium dendriticum]|nr:unnamed protein product [Dicrocoelium dendriticum]
MLTGCDERVRFTYTPNYCEENIYLLLRRLISEQIPGDFYTVFVSNRFSSVALFSQIKGDASRNHMVVWLVGLSRFPRAQGCSFYCSV